MRQSKKEKQNTKYVKMGQRAGGRAAEWRKNMQIIKERVLSLQKLQCALFILVQ